jgi:hypothetical protein
VIVRAEDDRAAPVAELMLARGAIDVESRVATWRQAGWTGFDPSAPPCTRGQIERERLMLHRGGTVGTARQALAGDADPRTGGSGAGRVSGATAGCGMCAGRLSGATAGCGTTDGVRSGGERCASTGGTTRDRANPAGDPTGRRCPADPDDDGCRAGRVAHRGSDPDDRARRAVAPGPGTVGIDDRPAGADRRARIVKVAVARVTVAAAVADGGLLEGR